MRALHKALHNARCFRKRCYNSLCCSCSPEITDLLPSTTCNSTNLRFLTNPTFHMATASDFCLQCLNLQFRTARVTNSIYKGHISDNFMIMAEYREQTGAGHTLKMSDLLAHLLMFTYSLRYFIIRRLSTRLWMTLHFGPSQRAKTLPCSHAWGFTAFVIVVPHNLHVKRTCSMKQGCMAANDVKLQSALTGHTDCVRWVTALSGATAVPTALVRLA